nr:4207_t:CDS:2 [Entrophospora candida]
MSGIETDDIDVEDNNETNETGINNDGIWRRKNLLIYLSVNNNLILCHSKDNLDDNDLGSNGNSNEYGLKYFEDYGSTKFIEIIGIDHCVGFLSFRPPNRKTEINCIIDDDDIDF